LAHDEAVVALLCDCAEILRFPGAFPGVEFLNLSHVATHSKIIPISG
jgi:hypothetical protein